MRSLKEIFNGTIMSGSDEIPDATKKKGLSASIKYMTAKMEKEDAEGNKTAGIGKGLLSGLLGVTDFTPEVLARQAGKGIRRSAVPVGAAGGAAVLVKKNDKHHEEKEASARDNLHLALAGAATAGSLASAHAANRAANTREKELKLRYPGEEKKAMWEGFEKAAAVFNIKHDKNVSQIAQKLRNLMSKKAGLWNGKHTVELGPETLKTIHRAMRGAGKRTQPHEILKRSLLLGGGLAGGAAIGSAVGRKLSGKQQQPHS